MPKVSTTEEKSIQHKYIDAILDYLYKPVEENKIVVQKIRLLYLDDHYSMAPKERPTDKDALKELKNTFESLL